MRLHRNHHASPPIIPPFPPIPTLTRTRYWDWAADWSNPPAAKVFDPITGFGGNGSSNLCLVDGPFKDLKPAYWNNEPRSEWSPPCLARVWEPGSPGVPAMLGDAYSPEVMQRINAIDDFDDFRRDLEGGPHAAVHRGVGGQDGDMGLQTASPNGEWDGAAASGGDI